MWIVNGRLIDPRNRIDGEHDLLVDDGRIAAVAPRGEGDREGQRIDASGKWVVPGLIDMHCHLREPGHEYKESILTGTRSAAAGGFTSVACMANTDPVNDSPAITEFILGKARREGVVNVFPIGAATRGLAGESLAEIGQMKEAGIVGVSDDGNPIMDSGVARRVFEYAKMFHLVVISHCEDRNLVGRGVMNEGLVSTRLGLTGVPTQAEEIMVARDILLAEMTGVRLHIAHISTAGSIRMLRDARDRGVDVTAEATPHHLTLTEEAVTGYRPDAKMAPPLRSEADVRALREAVADGTVEVIATDHAPHSPVEKEVEFDEAPNGIIGLETALPLVLKLVREGALGLERALHALTAAPALILRLDKGHLAEGADADITIIDPDLEFEFDPTRFYSKSRNTPFGGWKLRGRAVRTIVGGRTVFDLELGGIL
ncbi:MAG: dihydroorotase [Deltaproteobacteria bacterium]|nr:dihydroorotase [Deltaproteobacteria bacterium]